MIPASPTARHWSEALGLDFHEVRIETNGHNLSLVFSDLVVTEVGAGFSPFTVPLLRRASRPLGNRIGAATRVRPCSVRHVAGFSLGRVECHRRVASDSGSGARSTWLLAVGPHRCGRCPQPRHSVALTGQPRPRPTDRDGLLASRERDFQATPQGRKLYSRRARSTFEQASSVLRLLQTVEVIEGAWDFQPDELQSAYEDFVERTSRRIRRWLPAARQLRRRLPEVPVGDSRRLQSHSAA
jgi:hypothetical protein